MLPRIVRAIIVSRATRSVVRDLLRRLVAERVRRRRGRRPVRAAVSVRTPERLKPLARELHRAGVLTDQLLVRDDEPIKQLFQALATAVDAWRPSPVTASGRPKATAFDFDYTKLTEETTPMTHPTQSHLRIFAPTETRPTADGTVSVPAPISPVTEPASVSPVTTMQRSLLGSDNDSVEKMDATRSSIDPSGPLLTPGPSHAGVAFEAIRFVNGSTNSPPSEFTEPPPSIKNAHFIAFDTWREEVRAVHGSGALLPMRMDRDPAIRTAVRSLLAKYPLHDVRKLIRLAVRDWEAVKQGLTRFDGVPWPTLSDIDALSGRLAAFVSTGRTSAMHPISAYAKNFLPSFPAAPSASQHSGPPPWPPREPRDVWVAYANAVKEHGVGIVSAEPGTLDRRAAAELFTMLGSEPAKLLYVIRVAVWDWHLVERLIRPRMKKSPRPTLSDIAFFCPDLLNHYPKGITGGQVHRCASDSPYNQRFDATGAERALVHHESTLHEQCAAQTKRRAEMRERDRVARALEEQEKKIREERLRAGEPLNWPPETDAAVCRLWQEELVALHPDIDRRWLDPDRKDHGAARRLRLRFPPTDLLQVLRVAMYDWSAIQATIPDARGRPYPLLFVIEELAEQLAEKIAVGFVDANGKSAYRERWLRPTASPLPSTPSAPDTDPTTSTSRTG
jgi:hypothetical protein